MLAAHLDGGRLQLDLIFRTPTEFERDGHGYVGMRIEIRLEQWSDDLYEPVWEA